LYSVTFDFLQPLEYQSLKEKLRTLGASQILERQWALRTHLTAAELRNELKSFIDASDGIVVAEIGSEFASRRAKKNLAEL
jgi:hypothetical protein